jgi:ATP-dependent RNA helicase DDX42
MNAFFDADGKVFQPALLFSATFQKRVEKLAREALTDPVRISIGAAGQANSDIEQHPIVLEHDGLKWDWLMKHLTRFCIGAFHADNSFVFRLGFVPVHPGVLNANFHLDCSTEGSVIIFVLRKGAVDELTASIKDSGFECECRDQTPLSS